MTAEAPKGGPHNYATMAAMMLRSVPEKGFTLAQMELRLNMLDKFENAKVGDILEMEDAEIAVLVELEPRISFNILSREFVDFGKYLRSFAKPEAAKA